MENDWEENKWREDHTSYEGTLMSPSGSQLKP